MVMGSSRRNCLDSGLWDGTLALCAATCEPPQPPPRGSISCVDIAEIDGYTSACKITCDPGYQLIGQDVRLCNTSGIWSGESSKCVVSTTCPVLQTPLNGKIECVGDNSAAGKTSCKTSCFPGFSLYGDEIRSCETDGTWSGEETTCVETCSVPPTVKNGEFQCQQIKTNSLYQTFCRLECMTGYRLEGKIFETNCDSTGRWTDMDGMCRRITCPKLPNHDGNTLVCSPGELEDGDFPVGSECRTICNNYKASAHAWQHKKICTDKGTWIGPDAACPVDCEWSWSAWSTCGYNGKRTQKVIVGIPSKNGGRQCPQKIINEKECCKVEYASLDGICYTFHCENQTWSAAEENCKLAGGQLVKVDTIRKHQFLQQIMELKNLPDAWIGLSAKDGNFVWADGDSLGEFHRWFERDGLHKQPDNYRKSEGCVKMTSAWPKSVRYSSNFDWNDVDCYTYANYICEKKSDDCKN
ncbi:P-selectin-like [Styela clava]